MADVKKIATRDSYGNALVKLGEEFSNVVVLDADLAGATKTATFKKEFPDRRFADIHSGLPDADAVRFSMSKELSDKIMPIGAKMYQQSGSDANGGETNTHHVNADDNKDDGAVEGEVVE